jgi:hypothetical protein
MFRLSMCLHASALPYIVCAAAVAFAACALPSRRAVASATPVHARSCVYGQWSAPTVIESATPALNATRFPVLAAVAAGEKARHASGRPGSIGDVVGVAGYEAIDPRADLGWPGVWPPQLRVLRTGDKLSGPPSKEAYWYAYPRAATDSEGVLHVMWAEPESAPSASRRDVRRSVIGGDDPRFRTLWYAQLRDGRWSQPAQIFRTYGIEWHPQVSSQLLIDTAGRLRIAFPANDSTSSTLVYLGAATPRTPQWRSQVWRFMGGVGYADLATGERGRLALAVIKPPEPPESGRDLLYVMHSADGGSTWSALRRISRSAQEPAIEPHVFLRDTIVNVVWTSQPVGHFTDGIVWNASLVPEADDVRLSSGLPLSGATNGSRVAIDACGTVHFVVRQYKPPDGEVIAYARYDRNGWTPIEYPFEVGVSQPFIAVIRDTVRLLWSSVRRDSWPPIASLMTASMPISRVDQRSR